VSLLAVSFLATGCRRSPGEDVLLDSYRLGQQHRWNQALPHVKAYLIEHPDDAAGHYLLGQCYLHVPAPHLTIANGELQTALNCFQRTRDLGVFASLMTPNKFESDIHRRSALVYMRMVREGMTHGLPPGLLRPQLARALEHVRRARALDPASPILEEMEEALVRTSEELEREPGLPHRPVRQPRFTT